MPVLRSKTVRDENQLIEFMEANSIPGWAGPDYYGNSSGWISIFFNDATRDRGTTPIYNGSGNSANYAAALAAGHVSSAINVANAERIILGIEVVAAPTQDLHLNLRLSNLGAPNLTTASHWFRQLVSPNYTSSKYEADVAEYVIKHQLLTLGEKFTMEFPVAANWANLVLHNATGGTFKLYADIG